jgi:hypothetical protein
MKATLKQISIQTKLKSIHINPRLKEQDYTELGRASRGIYRVHSCNDYGSISEKVLKLDFLLANLATRIKKKPDPLCGRIGQQTTFHSRESECVTLVGQRKCVRGHGFVKDGV